MQTTEEYIAHIEDAIDDIFWEDIYDWDAEKKYQFEKVFFDRRDYP